MKNWKDYILYFVLFIWMPVIIWGAFFYAPPAKGLGDTARVIFFHVPMAWLSVIAFFMSAYYSFKLLKEIQKENVKIVYYDQAASTAAQIGLLFAFLATVTGSIWAKKIWHSYWNWDPRETSIFILLIIYGAYFALRSAITNPHDRMRLSAVYSLIAVVTVPFFVFIVPRIFASLHPDPLINQEGKIKMDGKMLLVFLNSLFAFTIFYFYLFYDKLKLLKQETNVTEWEEEYE
jgi:heme exporter protein C